MKTINIGGEDRPISFGRNAMIEFEKLTGQKLLSGNKNWFETAESWSTLMYCGLKWGLYNPNKGKEPIPDFTIYQVNDWIEQRIECLQDMWTIFNESFPQQKKNEELGAEDSHGKTSIK